MKDAVKKAIAVLLIVIFAVVFDQVTKIWAENNFASVYFPDHQIEVTVEPEMDGLNIDQFVTKKYGDSLDEEAAFRVKAHATRNNQHLTGNDVLKSGETISFAHMSRTVNPYWNYIYARNPGAAFSFMATQSETVRMIFFGITGLVALFALSAFIYMTEWKKKKFLIVTLACILGGALGNIIDRIRLTYVIDFISWHVGEATWPTFNIADVFVTGGIALLVIDLIVHHDDYNDKKSDDAEESNEELALKADSSTEGKTSASSEETEPPKNETEKADIDSAVAQDAELAPKEAQSTEAKTESAVADASPKTDLASEQVTA